MIKYVQAGTTDSVHVDFIHEGELVVPDTSSVEYSIYDGAMTIFNSREDVSITTDSTTTGVNIDLTSQDTAKSNDIELRFIEIKWQLNGVSMRSRQSYQVVDRVLFPVSEDDVRSVVGLDADELPNDYIDITKAYILIKREITTFETVLQAGSELVMDCIDAIKYKAAIEAILPLEMLANMRIQADNTSVSRFERLDFEAIKKRIKGKYEVSVGRIINSTPTDPDIVLVSTGTDAVTGA